MGFLVWFLIYFVKCLNNLRVINKGSFLYLMDMVIEKYLKLN